MGKIGKTLKKLFGEKFFYLLKSIQIKYFRTEQDIFDLKQAQLNVINRKNLYSGLVKHGELCFDVGANVGNRVKPLVQIGAKVVAIEPQQNCYEVLEQNFGSSILIVKKGLSDRIGKRKFYLSKDTTLSSFSEEWIDIVRRSRFKSSKWNKVIEVEMTTLDHLIGEYGIPVFIKIDVEGYELEVLKGLSYPVKYLSFEYTVPEFLPNALNCIDYYNSLTPELECNYSIGETMKFYFVDWLSVNNMKEHMQSKLFKDSYFGDIYLRTVSLL